jgi:MinD superfamily P-loop ATPase
MKKTVIKINSEKCTGCGKCTETCHQGAIQMINGKAVLINEHHCDGLGRCLGK